MGKLNEKSNTENMKHGLTLISFHVGARFSLCDWFPRSTGGKNVHDWLWQIFWMTLSAHQGMSGAGILRG